MRTKICHPITGEPPPRGYDSLNLIRIGGSTGKVGSFGMTRNSGQKAHKGVDYLCIPGRPVFCPMDGTVARAGFQDPSDPCRGHGLRVYIKHETEAHGLLVSCFSHLSALEIHRTFGTELVRGQIVGWTGRTGNVSDNVPSHLHWELWMSREVNGTPVDPERFMAEGTLLGMDGRFVIPDEVV